MNVFFLYLFHLQKQEDSDEYEFHFGASMQNNIKKTTENLRMKIVPDITEAAALNGSSFDASLSSDAAEYLSRLRQTWVSCKCARPKCAWNFFFIFFFVRIYCFFFQTKKVSSLAIF